MTTQTLPFAPPRPAAEWVAPGKPFTLPAPDLAVVAMPLLERAADALSSMIPEPSRWRAPEAHFFHAAVPRRKPTAHSDILDDALCLMGAVEVRHAARALPGLIDAARLAAPHCLTAARLLVTLELVDDEVIRVTMPCTGAVVRAVVRGVPDFARLGELLRESVGPGVLPGPVCQFVHPRAQRREGGIRPGVASAGDWFWGNQPLNRLPRVGGERHALAIPATVAASVGGTGLAHITAELELLDAPVVAARRAA